MRKIRVKKFGREMLRIDIILYLIIVLVGSFLILSTGYGSVTNITRIVVSLYIIGLFSAACYSVNLKEDDRSLLLLADINIICATLLALGSIFLKENLLMLLVMLIYSIMYLANEIYSSYKLYKKKDIMSIPTFSISFVIGIIGIYTSIIMFKCYEVSDYILGYYLVFLGLLSMLKPLCKFLFRNPNTDENIRKMLKYDTVKKNKRKMVMREVPKKKISKISK